MTPVLVAIALSSGTSVLAFGALAFSEVTAISSFGLTILIGILCALVLSPMVIAQNSPRERDDGI